MFENFAPYGKGLNLVWRKQEIVVIFIKYINCFPRSFILNIAHLSAFHVRVTRIEQQLRDNCSLEKVHQIWSPFNSSAELCILFKKLFLGPSVNIVIFSRALITMRNTRYKPSKGPYRRPHQVSLFPVDLK